MRKQAVAYGVARCLPFLARQLIIFSIWLIVVGFFGAAYLLAGRRPSPSSSDLLNFTLGFVIAAAIAAVMTLIFGGKTRFAFEIAIPVVMLIIVMQGGPFALIWFAPGLCQGLLRMNNRAFLSFQPSYLDTALEIVWLVAPTGAILEVTIGVVAGLFVLLGRRWPGFVRWSLMGLLLACTVRFVHIDIFRKATDLVIKYRLRSLNSNGYLWYLRAELAPAIGAGAGAVVGAAFSCLSIWLKRKSSSWHRGQ